MGDDYKVIRGSVGGQDKYCRIPIRRKRKTDKEIKKAIETMRLVEIAEVQDEEGMVIDAGAEMQRDIETAISAMQELEKYRELGTLEECHEAIEKQNSKPPYYEGDGYADGYPVYDTWICPYCGQDFEVEYDEYEYCPNCGQHIDWGEENEQ